MKRQAEKPAFVVHKDDSPQALFRPMTPVEQIFLTVVAMLFSLLIGVLIAAVILGGV